MNDESNESDASGAVHRLAPAEASARLATLPDWRIDAASAGGRLCKEFRFADYAATIRFVVAVAAIAEAENHHPDLAVGYGRVGVSFTTHDCGGLSQRDFHCASRVETLVGGGEALTGSDDSLPGTGAAS